MSTSPRRLQQSTSLGLARGRFAAILLCWQRDFGALLAHSNNRENQHPKAADCAECGAGTNRELTLTRPAARFGCCPLGDFCYNRSQARR